MSEDRLFRLGARTRSARPKRCSICPPPCERSRDLIGWLTGRGEEYAYAFENPKVIRAAIDRAHVKPDAVLAGAREIAFFPPMTGG